MANRYFKGEVKTLEGGVVKLFGTFTTTTLGVIGSKVAKGFTIAKVAAEAGRYRVTLNDEYNALLMAQAIVQGTADTAYATAKGLTAYVRNVNVSASPPVFDLQFADVALADGEIADGATVHLEITLKNSTTF